MFPTSIVNMFSSYIYAVAFTITNCFIQWKCKYATQVAHKVAPPSPSLHNEICKGFMGSGVDRNPWLAKLDGW